MRRFWLCSKNRLSNAPTGFGLLTTIAIIAVSLGQFLSETAIMVSSTTDRNSIEPDYTARSATIKTRPRRLGVAHPSMEPVSSIMNFPNDLQSLPCDQWIPTTSGIRVNGPTSSLSIWVFVESTVIRRGFRSSTTPKTYWWTPIVSVIELKDALLTYDCTLILIHGWCAGNKSHAPPQAESVISTWRSLGWTE